VSGSSWATWLGESVEDRLEQRRAARREREEALLGGLTEIVYAVTAVTGTPGVVESSGRIQELERAITAHIAAVELSELEVLTPSQEAAVAGMVAATWLRLRELVGLEVES